MNNIVDGELTNNQFLVRGSENMLKINTDENILSFKILYRIICT